MLPANYKDMKFYLIFILSFVLTMRLSGQINQTTQKGNYFKTTSDGYFERVIKPWKYQFTKTDVDKANDSVNKVGQIIFWRSEAIYDNVSKEYWKPDISYDIYFLSDSAHIKNLANNI